MADEEGIPNGLGTASGETPEHPAHVPHSEPGPAQAASQAASKGRVNAVRSLIQMSQRSHSAAGTMAVGTQRRYSFKMILAAALAGYAVGRLMTR
ncbi:hypothetical protein FHS55_003441 [Angulomicrobium tetraedrale]|uniref:Uncharacterized protein n=1 Tax=Ancylobacter tetraedralis TaxID=217068 RepID=A0A839ZDS4_9HYPH|nr:hypothetical protein [Ancylobacter tetraedralis]MBB3772816.1 hypothetical protein [Ancylobacter tetraedralis]